MWYKRIHLAAVILPGGFAIILLVLAAKLGYKLIKEKRNDRN